MSTTRRIVRTESISNWPNDSRIDGQNLNLSWSATNNGAGKDWTITTPASTDPSGSDQYGTVTLNTSTPESRFFQQTITTDDYRVADTVYNIPASRCSVDINMTMFGAATVTQGGSGVAVTSQAEVIINGITYTPDISGTNTAYTLYRSTAGNLKQTGSDVTTQTAGLNQNTIVAKYRQRATSYNPDNSIPNTTISFHSTNIGGPFTRYWEADLHVIDGVVDSVSFDACVSSIDAQPTLIKYAAKAELNTTTSLQEISANKKIATPNIETVDTDLLVVPSFKRGFTRELTVQSNLLASTENLVPGIASLQATTTQASDGHITFGITDQLTAQVSTSTSAGLIYDITGDYTWDSWSVSTWLGNEQTWDNWPEDVWEKPYIIGTAGSLITIPSFILGDVVSYTGTFTFDEDSAFEKASQADLTAQFTTDFTASGVIDVEADLSGAFAPSLTANISYSLDDTPIVITGAFTPVLTASAITDTFADIDVSFALAVEPTFRPGTTPELYQTQSTVDINPTFKPSGFSDMVASAGTLTVGRIFYSADPYNTTKISQEIRRVVLPEQNRRTLVMAENRLNTITQETGDYLVPQETRSIKLRIPPFKNRFSTPRVRSEQ